MLFIRQLKWVSFLIPDGSVKAILKKLLLKRLEQPRTPGAELRGDLRDCYKIKLLGQGFRGNRGLSPIFFCPLFSLLQLERAAAGQKGIHVKALQVGTGRWL